MHRTWDVRQNGAQNRGKVSRGGELNRGCAVGCFVGGWKACWGCVWRVARGGGGREGKGSRQERSTLLLYSIDGILFSTLKLGVEVPYLQKAKQQCYGLASRFVGLGNEIDSHQQQSCSYNTVNNHRQNGKHNQSPTVDKKNLQINRHPIHLPTTRSYGAKGRRSTGMTLTFNHLRQGAGPLAL